MSEASPQRGHTPVTPVEKDRELPRDKGGVSLGSSPSPDPGKALQKMEGGAMRQPCWVTVEPLLECW